MVTEGRTQLTGRDGRMAVTGRSSRSSRTRTSRTGPIIGRGCHTTGGIVTGGESARCWRTGTQPDTGLRLVFPSGVCNLYWPMTIPSLSQTESVSFSLLGLPFPATLCSLLDKRRSTDNDVAESQRFPQLRGPAARRMKKPFLGRTCRLRVRGKGSQARIRTFGKRVWQDSNLRHTAPETVGDSPPY